ncbi:hypothetical protein C0Q70_15832 [Pomacea canaliculata]|uniref:Receptor ligand binding region domain-containing protein n=1 Tax=Pomacea canaliculata TaxID=400727 RepID=A0A2T7NVZ5_POMCA|nr:hypothetical protein C0Q70_15832 [Pomacea canaliculata]
MVSVTGFDLLDDCRSPTRAMQYALDYMDIYNRCGDNQYNTTLRLGLVGPSRSSTAEEVADAMRGFSAPIISPAATVATLTTGDISHPNFFRTVPSDRLQLAAIIQILKQLSWSFVALVYTDDVYGTTGSRMLQEMAVRERICINTSIVITSDPAVMTSVVSQLIGVRARAKDQSLAVVYIGAKDKAENLVFNLKSQRALGFHFIFSDSVSTNLDVFKSGQLPNTNMNLAVGSLTLAPSSVTLRDFEDYLNRKYTSVHNGSDNDTIIASYLKVSGWTWPLQSVSQVSFVPLAVGAIYALAEATRLTHQEVCGNDRGVCAAMVTAVAEGAVLRYMKNLSVNFSAMNADVAPQEFRRIGYILEFDENGDVVPSGEFPDYVVYSYNNELPQPLLKVGNYTGGKLSLDTSQVKMLTTYSQVVQRVQTSVCAGECVECADNGKIPVAHLNGSAVIVGVFSVHVRQGDSPFKAFLHSVQQLRASTGVDFGAVAFDDCYSPLRINTILSTYLSQHVTEEQCGFSVCVDPDQVVGVIGSLSSGSTMAVADFFTPLRVPVISYAASSPDFDDKVNFPFFLRTVPSDDEQAKAMAAVIEEMGWSYVGLLYVNNNYGTKGALAFQRTAAARGICVADPVIISENPSSVDEKDLYDAFIALIEKNVKVVVFFGIDTRMADFLRLVESRGEFGRLLFLASEEWASKDDVLNAGPKAARGSITIKVNNVDTNPQDEDLLRKELLQKVPSRDDPNPWFSEFWQNFFDCNIPGGFNNVFSKDCNPTTRLSSTEVARLLSDQRVKHVMNAVSALGWGLHAAKDEFCEDKFPCSFLRNAKYATKVLDSIKSQVVTVHSLKESVFDDRGNGDIGFSLFNIQKDDLGYTYKLVGSYIPKQGLQLQKEDLRFYTETGRETSQVDAQCSGTLCDHCPQQLTASSPAPQDQTDKGEHMQMAILVILALLLVVCLLLVCGLALSCAYFRRKVQGLTKQLQEQKSEPVYHAVQERQVYGNVMGDMTSVPLPQPQPQYRHDDIRFVNSRSNSPADTLDGRYNPAFTPDGYHRRQLTLDVTAQSSQALMTQRSVAPSDHNATTTTPAPGTAPELPVRQSSMASVTRVKGPTASESEMSQHPYDEMNSTASENAFQSGVASPARTTRVPTFPMTFQNLEAIPLQVMGPANTPDYRQTTPPDYRQQLESPQYHHQQVLIGNHRSPPRQGSEVNSIQYFQMTPTGQLEEMEGDEGGEIMVDTYMLPSQPGMQPGQGTQHLQVFRRQSLSPVSYSESSRSLLLNPDARDLLLQQLLVEKLAQLQQQQNGTPGASGTPSSSNDAAHPGCPTQRPPQHQFPPSRSELQQQESVGASTLYPSSSSCSSDRPQHQQQPNALYTSSSNSRSFSEASSDSTPGHQVASSSPKESPYTILPDVHFARLQDQQSVARPSAWPASGGSDSGRSSGRSRSSGLTFAISEPATPHWTLGSADSLSDNTDQPWEGLQKPPPQAVENLPQNQLQQQQQQQQQDHELQRQRTQTELHKPEEQTPVSEYLGLHVSTV